MTKYHELVIQLVKAGLSRREASFAAFREINKLLPAEPVKPSEAYKKANASISHGNYLNRKN